MDREEHETPFVRMTRSSALRSDRAVPGACVTVCPVGRLPSAFLAVDIFYDIFYDMFRGGLRYEVVEHVALFHQAQVKPQLALTMMPWPFSWCREAAFWIDVEKSDASQLALQSLARNMVIGIGTVLETSCT